MIVFLQIGFAVRSKSMLSADFVLNAMPRIPRRILLVLVLLLGAVFFLFLMKGRRQAGSAVLRQR